MRNEVQREKLQQTRILTSAMRSLRAVQGDRKYYMYACWGREVSVGIFNRIAKEDLNKNMSKFVTGERKRRRKIFAELYI